MSEVYWYKLKGRLKIASGASLGRSISQQNKNAGNLWHVLFQEMARRKGGLKPHDRFG